MEICPLTRKANLHCSFELYTRVVGHLTLCRFIMVDPTKDEISPIDRMDEYKGGSFPEGALAAVIPGSGFVAGLVVPFCLRALLKTRPSESCGSIDSVLEVLRQFGYVTILFTVEFILGTVARSESPKAAFSPSAAAASGKNPFTVVQANRIHQNHIEALCIMAPSALAAAASGADPSLVALTVKSWVAFRFLYRLGYCYEKNPFWRLFGVAASNTQANICLCLWYNNFY